MLAYHYQHLITVLFITPLILVLLILYMCMYSSSSTLQLQHYDLHIAFAHSDCSLLLCLQSNSSEKTLPDQSGEKRGSGDGEAVMLHHSMYRQPSLSKALEEWDIPYSELIVEEELGTGHVGTVYKYA